MKKIIILSSAILTFFSSSVNAQDKPTAEKYGKTLNLGAGIGYYGYLGQSLPVGMLNFEFDVARNFTLAPFVGLYTDRKPQPYSLAIGMGFTLVGLIFLSRAPSFDILILSVAMVGIGSSIFHPEASRMAHMASGGRRGMAQSIFQLGGNFGSSIGPLLAALIIVPYGQSNIIWFSALALLAII